MREPPAEPADPRTGRLLRNLREMELGREAYWRRHTSTSATKLRWRALTVKHAFHVQPGETILELGAGSGLWTAHLAAELHGENPITAVVLDDALAAELEARALPNVTVHRPGPDGLDLPPGAFDYAVGTSILSHDAYAANLRALLPALRPGGQILFFEANFWNPQVLAKSLIPGVGRWSGNAPHQIGMRKYRLLQETTRQGFTNVEIIPFDIVHPRTPARAVDAVQSLAFLLEQAPAVRELCGTLYIWARKPGDRRARRRHPNLAVHEALRDSTSIVVPCHDEETTIATLIAALLEAYDAYVHEIVVVDDCSTDRTAEVVRALALDEPRVKLVSRQPPGGVGRALRDGYAAASGRYVLSLDADFTLIVPELRGLFDAVAAGRDGAIGSRFSRDSILVNYPFPKIVANRSFHALLRLLTGMRVRDVTNNLKLYPRALVERLEITEDGFAANAETGIGPLLEGCRIEEVPISWIDRTPEMGRSSFGIVGAGPGYARVLARTVRRRHRGRGAGGPGSAP